MSVAFASHLILQYFAPPQKRPSLLECDLSGKGDLFMSEGKLKIHSDNILPIIKKWLYSDKDIFVRELVSNATDAIQKLIILRDQNETAVENDTLRIDIAIDKEKKTLTFTDTGIGMSAEEIEKYIAEVAFSGAEEFVKNYKSNQESDQIIGHFGLGFYSAFMVAKHVDIDSLSYKEGAKAAHWSCDGSTTYHLKDGSRETRGTAITLHIEDEEYLDSEKIRSILKTYCSFLPFPIFLNGEQVNKEDPLWLKNAKDCTDEEYLEFYRKLHPGEPDPIFWFHLNVDHPFHLKGILYFPKITPRFDFQSAKIKLFSNRVFVSDNLRDLFPDFLTVLRGGIDSPDIPLNVSRSYLQMDSTVRKLSTHITKKIADRLSSLFKSDREKFASYWPDIETIVKLGILHDDKFYEKCKDFLLWKTTEGEWLTAEEYSERYKDSYSGKIFYTTSEQESSNFLSLYKEKNIAVIIGGGPLDTAIFNHLEMKNGLKFQRIDGGIDDVILDKEREKTLLDADGKSESAKIAELVKGHLGKESVEVEAKSLTSESLPAFVMIEESARRMRDYFSMTQKEMPSDLFGKQTFVVNTNNKLIEALPGLSRRDPELAKALTEQIYELSLLSQKELHPDLVTGFINRTSSILEKLAVQVADKSTEQAEEAETAGAES